jgi:SAM-dependent methyltransferase
MDAKLSQRLEASGYTEPGFADRYDRYRPRPPKDLVDLLLPLADTTPPLRVVDLGSGTGLSTRIWAEWADEVIGVEPNDAMRSLAERLTGPTNVRYVAESAFATGVPDGSAAVITASQSLQWMEPELVFPEIERLLRPGGVFCAYQYDRMQTPFWEVDEVWQAARARRSSLLERYELDRDQPRWPVAIEHFEDGERFRYSSQMALHSVEYGDGARLLGFAMSEGWVTTLLRAGASEEEIGLDRLRRAAAGIREPVPWWISYRAWLGVK